MLRTPSVSAIAAVVLIFQVAGAEAKVFKCDALVAAVGVSSHTEAGRALERQKGHAPPGIAKERAIAGWKEKVSMYCPSHSNKWWRARTATVVCETDAGLETCTARATPAQKLLSVLFD